MEGNFYDDERTDWSDASPRPLRYTCWYPTDSPQEETEILLGPPGQPLFRMGCAIVAAPLSAASTQYPVVLVSHGTGGSADGMGWLGCRLAARGYVALGISHHGNTVLEPYLPQGFLCWWERAEDLSVGLDQLLEHPSFRDRLDTSRVFAAGFSLGGYTVMALAGALTNLDLFTQFITANPGSARNGPKEFPDLSDHIDGLLESGGFAPPTPYRMTRISTPACERRSSAPPPPPCEASPTKASRPLPYRLQLSAEKMISKHRIGNARAGWPNVSRTVTSPCSASRWVTTYSCASPPRQVNVWSPISAWIRKTWTER